MAGTNRAFVAQITSMPPLTGFHKPILKFQTRATVNRLFIRFVTESPKLHKWTEE
jgi:hypothetical protein